MRIGILGSGLMGGKLGTLWTRAGHDVVFSYARSKDKLKRLASNAGGNAQAGTPRDAANGADALLLAVHWSRVDEVLKQAGDLSGAVIIVQDVLGVGEASAGGDEPRAAGPAVRRGTTCPRLMCLHAFSLASTTRTPLRPHGIPPDVPAASSRRRRAPTARFTSSVAVSIVTR